MRELRHDCWAFLLFLVLGDEGALGRQLWRPLIHILVVGLLSALVEGASSLLRLGQHRALILGQLQALPRRIVLDSLGQLCHALLIQTSLEHPSIAVEIRELVAAVLGAIFAEVGSVLLGVLLPVIVDDDILLLRYVIQLAD